MHEIDDDGAFDVVETPDDASLIGRVTPECLGHQPSCS